MKKLVLALLASAGAWSAAHAEGPPAWAFPVNPPGLVAAKDDGKMHKLPGSEATFSFGAMRNRFAPPDWYPEDHPAMPSLVSHGAEPGAFACGYCHLPNGFGRPENANLSGLPAAYIIKQVQDFKTGARKTSVPVRTPPKLMGELAVQASTDPGLEATAKYFESVKPKQMTRVVETDMAPKTEVDGWILKKAAGGGTEPIGQRIVEVPDDFDRFEERDARLMFTAYVPPGSIKAGEALVKTGGDGKTIPCGICHGADLKGLGDVPPIVGRSPIYVFRQLNDIKIGTRTGGLTPLMKGVVDRLGDDDMVAIAAYLVSQAP